MEKFRISNDLSIFWSITNKDGSPYTLSDKTVRLFVTHPRGRVEVTQDITIQDNVICWLFRGSKQRYLGTYRITAEIQASPSSRIIRKDIPEAFELVSSTRYEQTEIGRPDINEAGELNLATSLDIFQIQPIVPQIGPNGNWWVDGVDTGKSSVGLTAYEFAKEQGYEGTEEEYAAECLAVPVLNEESRSATGEAIQATEDSIAQQEEVSSYMKDVAEPTIERATAAALNAEQVAANIRSEADAALEDVEAAIASVNQAAENANAAAVEATEAASKAAKDVQAAIDEIGPVLNGKADKVQFEGKSYVETDGISTDDFYYSMPDSADGTEDDIIATKSNLKKINGQDLYGEGNIVIEGKNYDNEISALQQKDTQTETAIARNTAQITQVGRDVGEMSAKLAELSAEMSAISGGVTLNKSMYSNGVEKADVGFYITPFIPVTSSDKISVVISPSITSKCLVLYDSSYQVIDYWGLYSDKQISLSTYSKSAYVRTIFKMGEGGSMSINGTLVWDNSSFEFPSFAISTDLIQTWILADLYIPSNIIRGVDGNVKSCDVTWCDGVKGNMNISRDSRGNVMSVTATYNGKTYVLTIARDSEGNVTSTNIQ